MESYDVVEDYAERIRRSRERLGWTPATLALKVKEKENVIRRIESGRLKPTIDLALRLERVLKVKLLEPIVDEGSLRSVTEAKGFELTLGDVANVRKRAR
ncbi:MAG TPA: TIGR00270 family protein, partial [Chromatiaceae bacterium]|nr:TIGR00270 family protein [Chromatiaceae bacterium]